MSLLAIYTHASDPGDASAVGAPGAAGVAAPLPELITSDASLIAAELDPRGVRFQRWEASVQLPPGAEQAQILAAYAADVARVQQGGSFPTVDAIRLEPSHPDRTALRQKFLAEHTHSEDEVRFFVEGRGLFCLHIGEDVLQLVCEKNDWISVPAGTKHWFDMGPQPEFCALRFFDNPEGWVASFTGDPIASRYPLLDELMDGR